MSLNQLQDFYKQTISIASGAGAGKIYVSAKPTPVNGYCVISPSNLSLREIVRYTGTGNDASGDYITIANASDRGLGGTVAQAHAVGESIRMNITAEHWADLITELSGFAPINNPTFTGIVTVPTPTTPNSAVTKAYADVFASQTGNNNFSGSNNFVQSPTIPDALSSNQPVTLSQLLSAVLGVTPASFEYWQVQYRDDGLVRSVRDNTAGVTYVFKYDANRKLQRIFNGTKMWLVNLSRDKIISVTR